MLKNKQIKFGLFDIGETLIDANTNEKGISDYLEQYDYRIYTKIPNNYLFYHNS